MANVTDEDILLRVEALLALVPAITTVITYDDAEECPLTADDLPAAIVMFGEGAQRKDQTDIWTGDTDVEIGVMFALQCSTSVVEQRANMLTALRLRDAVPDYFNPLDRLTLNGRPMNGIDQPTVMRKSRLQIRPWGEETYWDTTYYFTVPTERR